ATASRLVRPSPSHVTARLFAEAALRLARPSPSHVTARLFAAAALRLARPSPSISDSPRRRGRASAPTTLAQPFRLAPSPRRRGGAAARTTIPAVIRRGGRRGD